MLTKQERRTQRKVLEQRNAARAEVESLKAEVERLHGDVRVLAAEEIRKIERENAAQLAKANTDKVRAEKERAELLADFEGALTRKLDETKRDLESTKAQLAAAQKEVLGLVERNMKLVTEVAGLTEALERRRLSEEKLSAELASAKMEDTKQLRKRLQVKTQRVEELEREVERLKRAPASSAVPVSPQALREMLNTQLRRKLEQDNKRAEAVPPSPPPAPEQPQP